jgi:hypothetical protein
MGRKTVLAGFLLLLSLLIGLVGRGGAGLPELHLQKIVLEPPSPVARGEVVVIHAWVMNTGDRPAGEFKVEFFYRRQGGEKWTSFHVVVVPNLAPSRQEAPGGQGRWPWGSGSIPVALSRGLRGPRSGRLEQPDPGGGRDKQRIGDRPDGLTLQARAGRPPASGSQPQSAAPDSRSARSCHRRDQEYRGQGRRAVPGLFPDQWPGV